ncbi:MAG: DUF3182 family protein [Betaproteobacteria bacterium]
MPSTRPVVTYHTRPAHATSGHDVVGRRAVAARLAATMEASYEGDFESTASYEARPYFVPDDALDRGTAMRLGIVAADDLFGGVVPHAFVATKAITHGLCDGDARAPDGWAPAFGSEVEDAVLRGYTAFSHADALRAVRLLLDLGPVRLKRCDGIGGGGQEVVESGADAKRALAAIDQEALASTGIVVEENLAGVTTYSVGQVSAGGIVLSYCGTQRTVRNARGNDVYGGSTLECVRGGLEALGALSLADDARNAVEFARRYDAAAMRAYPGLFASRRNYDVAHGADACGKARVGVLEQSWRAGGASGAEVRALEAFLADAGVDHVRASTVETYEPEPVVPPGAFVYFQGLDAHGSPLTKYATLSPDADAR